MPSFVVQHIDALITTAVGISASFSGYRSPRATTPTRLRAAKFLRICGPLVVLFGILGFFTGQREVVTWQRHLTSDGFASVEFPATPQAKEQTDTLNGVSVQRTTLYCDVPSKDISLFLSFTPVPPNEPGVSDADRIAAVKAYFTKQGFSVVSESPVQLGAASGFALDLQRDADKLRTWMRIAIVAGKAYRVVVSSTDAHHDDPIIRHYLESFRIERTGA